MIAVGVAGRYITRNTNIGSIQKLFSISGLNGSKYYRGGFEQNMSRREAALILGVSQQSSRNKIRDAHKRSCFLTIPIKAAPHTWLLRSIRPKIY
ncbi:unnamed protein product [Schistosoma mattheei]|uniref:Uncharacterized protein n=1 Tax=Schistosoma mattheei TaxID=31246 RepID=A0AA85B1Y6_9TREM|nr:unnamed protein product [Schistosoma mattheei]